MKKLVIACLTLLLAGCSANSSSAAASGSSAASDQPEPVVPEETVEPLEGLNPEETLAAANKTAGLGLNLPDGIQGYSAVEYYADAKGTVQALYKGGEETLTIIASSSKIDSSFTYDEEVTEETSGVSIRYLKTGDKYIAAFWQYDGTNYSVQVNHPMNAISFSQLVMNLVILNKPALV